MGIGLEIEGLRLGFERPEPHLALEFQRVLRLLEASHVGAANTSNSCLVVLAGPHPGQHLEKEIVQG